MALNWPASSIPAAMAWPLTNATRVTKEFNGLLLHDPNVAVVNRVAVALQLNGAGSRAFGHAATGRAVDLHFVVDKDAVVLHGDDGVPGILALGVEPGGGEVDVVGLPRERREAQVLGRLHLGIDAAALVVLALEPEAVQHLDFV